MLQENTEVRAKVAWKEVPVPQPLIVVRGTISKPKDTFLVADKMVLSKIKDINIHVAL